IEIDPRRQCPFEATRWTVVKHKLQRDLIIHRILPDPRGIEHRRISPMLLNDADTRPRNQRSQEYHSTWWQALSNEREIHPTRGVCDTNNVRWRLARTLERLNDGIGMPRRAFVSPVQVERRRENAVPSLFEFMHE